MLFSFLRDVFVFSLISVNMSTWRAGGRGGKDDFKLPVIVDEPVVERVTVEEGCQAWRGSYCQSPTYVNYHPFFFWDFFLQNLGAIFLWKSGWPGCPAQAPRWAASPRLPAAGRPRIPTKRPRPGSALERGFHRGGGQDGPMPGQVHEDAAPHSQLELNLNSIDGWCISEQPKAKRPTPN